MTSTKISLPSHNNCSNVHQSGQLQDYISSVHLDAASALQIPEVDALDLACRSADLSFAVCLSDELLDGK